MSVKKPRRRRRVRPSVVIASAMLLVVFALVAVFPFLPWYDPFAQDLSNARVGPFEDSSHLLGTDTLGRDMASRLSLATRTSLLVVGGALALNVVVGVTLGLIAGYFGGWTETTVMGLADFQLSFPLMILLVTIIAVIGPSTTALAVILGLAHWMGYGRVARALALSLRRREYVLAAMTHAASSTWIIRKHLLPQVIAPVAIMASFDLGVLVVLESSLSYLGLGVQPPTPSLGGMIQEGQRFLQTEAWAALLPGTVLFLLVAGVQILSQRFTSELSGLRGSGGAEGTAA
jgi:peptide/nickel transport system permease protein